MVGVPKIAMELGWAKLCVCGEGSARERFAQKRLLLPTPPRQLDSWTDTLISEGRAAPGLCGLRPDPLSVKVQYVRAIPLEVWFGFCR